MAIERIDCLAVTSEIIPGWTLVGGGTKPAAMQDAADGTYIYHTLVGSHIRFSLTNPVVITASDTINHIITTHRSQATSGGFGLRRFKVRILDILLGFTDAPNQRLGNSWVNYTNQFNNAPAGGAWSLAELNGLSIQQNIVSLTAQNRMAEFFVDIDYTVGSAAAQETRKLLGVGL